MPQKTNKIIVLISLLILTVIIVYAIISLKPKPKPEPASSLGNIYVSVFGQSWDTRIIDDVAIPNIKLNLFRRDDFSTIIAQGVTDENGSYLFTIILRRLISVSIPYRRAKN